MERLGYRWGLSPRDVGILAAMAEWRSSGEVMAGLGLQPGTLKAYLRRMHDKLEVDGSGALRTFAKANFGAGAGG